VPAEIVATRFRHLVHEEILGHRVPVATTAGARLLGLAHLDRERTGTGLLIPRCRSVHTFGMRFCLDLFFLDRRGALVSHRLAVPPRRIAICGQASAVLELPAGQGEEICGLES
jgi:uncharacterized membrane protein (UPF0127 family)